MCFEEPMTCAPVMRTHLCMHTHTPASHAKIASVQHSKSRIRFERNPRFACVIDSSRTTHTLYKRRGECHLPLLTQTHNNMNIIDLVHTTEQGLPIPDTMPQFSLKQSVHSPPDIPQEEDDDDVEWEDGYDMSVSTGEKSLSTGERVVVIDPPTMDWVEQISPTPTPPPPTSTVEDDSPCHHPTLNCTGEGQCLYKCHQTSICHRRHPCVHACRLQPCVNVDMCGFAMPAWVAARQGGLCLLCLSTFKCIPQRVLTEASVCSLCQITRPVGSIMARYPACQRHWMCLPCMRDLLVSPHVKQLYWLPTLMESPCACCDPDDDNQSHKGLEMDLFFDLYYAHTTEHKRFKWHIVSCPSCFSYDARTAVAAIQRNVHKREHAQIMRTLIPQGALLSWQSDILQFILDHMYRPRSILCVQDAEKKSVGKTYLTEWCKVNLPHVQVFRLSKEVKHFDHEARVVFFDLTPESRIPCCIIERIQSGELRVRGVDRLYNPPVIVIFSSHGAPKTWLRRNPNCHSMSL